MASREEIVVYFCDQMRGAGEITYRKMFGEYGVYCDGKIIGAVCDDQLFLKKTQAGAAILPDCPEAAPYEGAKPYFLIEDPEDPELLTRLVRASWEELPFPKPRGKKRGGGK